MKTIEIDNKYYQEVDVIMLDTLQSRLHIAYGKCVYQSVESFEQMNKELYKSQHIYFYNDEEINNEEFGINGYYEVVKLISKEKGCVKCSRVSDGMEITGGFLPQKIISTTDELKLKDISKTLGVYQIIPQIPQSFIQQYIDAYNSGNTICRVLVEVDKTNLRPDNSMGYFEEGAYTFDWKLKLNESNEVITLIK